MNTTSKRLGIVLAAGESSRLPNKLLLPQRMGVPIILSSITLCRSVCSEVRVIVREGGILEAWLRPFTEVNPISKAGSIRLLPQPMIDTIMDRLELVNVTGYDEVLIAFGDNVYPLTDTIRIGASIRTYTGPNADQLDGWDSVKKEWVDRVAKPIEKLAGWILLCTSQWEKFLEGIDLIASLNLAGVEPVSTQSMGWYDCGTGEAYKHYLSERG